MKSSLPASTNLPQPRDVSFPDFTSNTYAPFAFAITGNISQNTSMGVLWAPVQARFVLRGGYILAICVANLVGGGPTILQLFDEKGFESTPQYVMPVGMYNPTTTVAGDLICGAYPAGANAAGARMAAVPFEFDLGRGYRSRAIGNRLLIGGGNIGAGQIYVSGLVWGVQET